MIAIDDGIAQGNLNAADIFFLIGAILALVGSLLYVSSRPSAHPWAPIGVGLGVTCIAFGLFLL